MSSRSEQRFAESVFWSTFSSISLAGVSVVTGVFLVRIMGLEGFGKYALIQSSVGLLGILIGMGVGTAVTKSVAELLGTDNQKLHKIIFTSRMAIASVSLLVSILIGFFAKSIAVFVFDDVSFWEQTLYLIPSLTFFAFDSLNKSLLIGSQQTKRFALASVVPAFLVLPLMLLSAEVHGVRGVSIMISISAFLNFLLSRYLVQDIIDKRIIIETKKFDKDSIDLNFVTKAAIPSMLGQIAVAPAQWVMHLILLNGTGGFGAVGLFGLATQWFNIVMFAPAAIGKVVLPILTKKYHHGSDGSAKKFVFLACSANLFVSCVVAMPLLFFTEQIVDIYGRDLPSVYFIQLAVLSAIVLSFQSPIGNMVIAAADFWLGVVMNVAWMSIYLFLGFILTEEHGVTGASVALLVSYCLHLTWTTIYAKNKLDKK
ncbi:oligosaccharide flippase family protein [Luminiphilus sp.]|nr:oligosaccharide flippase family protein [Luminiphilus sp.]